MSMGGTGTEGAKESEMIDMIDDENNVPPSVDEIVRDQVFYMRLCEEQSVVFRQNVEEFTKEYDLYKQSADIVKPGQNWQPAPRDRDAFVAEMQRRCEKVPKSIADRVKIFCAAHAIIACTVFVDMTRHPEKTRLEILSETAKQWWHCEDFIPSTTQRQPALPARNLLMRSKPNPSTRCISAKEHNFFKENPAALVDEQFLLKEDEDVDRIYEVTEVKFLKRNWEYLVRFEGCFDCVNISGLEMLEMLEKSSLVTGTRK